MDKLSGDYIAGFVDGEGCFYLNYTKEIKYKRKRKPVYWRWVVYFYINVKEDDIEILKKIKDTLACGKIFHLKSKNHSLMVMYSVQNINDVYTKVVPFFRKYNLYAKKKHDFELWTKAVEIIYKHSKKSYKNSKSKPYTQKENRILIKLRNNMKKYKAQQSDDYKYFPTI